MNINNARFEKGAVKPEQYPDNDIPEITFVGRSNVGKSSLINALLNRKNLAKVASKPGRTREINFYNVDDTVYFVDLPGYGYAKVSKEVKYAWSESIETYLNTSKKLKMIVMVVDIRHTPTDDDKMMNKWLVNSSLPYLVVATKMDKIPRSKLKERLLDISGTLKLDSNTPLVPFSAETKEGRETLMNYIVSVL
ncbi:ribosome biogenesis GTP-binding protein YihA/YsxC [Acetivibrio clariflavus]|uniref:Probable GTP-binding protein EngB n=1 Tax=Acetivibrio clariflavus (strain DSM 19732 / NBRC 101661 / EBR45) TaxID=720554 RepID=G8M0N7_ACECE|nr:ribosome biogenesis GTP-binding protein YihA/YsxC [Acetivibrio clariflavus]AEV69118.1 ribosome biogenesis GTP-binding protein YsxC/EngB [Acetivibrio clariflavus DSM 19732]